MSDIQALSASIGADVAQFLAAMQQSAAAITELTKAQAEATQASHAVAEATAAHAAASEHAAAAHEGHAHDVGALSQAYEGLQETLSEVTKGFAVAELVAQGVEKGLEAIKEFVGETIKAAAGAEMISVQFNNAFGTGAAEAKEWAETTGAALGRSADDMMKAATSAKVMADGMGVGGEEAVTMSEGLAKMAVQMSIARGIPLDEAVQAIDHGLAGMGRGLKEFGIILDPTTQNLEAMNLGLGDQYTKLSEAEKALVNYTIMQEHSSKLASDAAMAAGTYSNQVASLKSNWEEVTAQLGSIALPLLTSLTSGLNVAVKAFSDLSANTKGWIATLAWGPVGLGVRALDDLISRAKEILHLTGNGELPTAAYQGAMSAADMGKSISGIAAHDQQTQDSADATDEVRAKAAEAEAARQRKIYDDVLSAVEHMKKAVEASDAAHYAAMLKTSQEELKAVEQAAALRHALDESAKADAKTGIADAKDAANRADSYLAIQRAAGELDSAFARQAAAAEGAVAHDREHLDLATRSAQLLQDTGTGTAEEIQLAWDAAGKAQEQLAKDVRDQAKDLREAADHFGKVLKDYQANQGLGNAGAQLAGATQFGGLASHVAAASAGGPMAMAGAAGVDLLMASKGGKDAIAAADKIFQQVADTVGKLVEPLVPVIQAVSAAIKPVLDALGVMFKSLGSGFAKTLQSLLAPLEGLMAPLGHLLSAIAPLIGPIQAMAGLFSVLLAGFDPFILALQALAPVLDFVANIINVFVDGVRTIWNSIVRAIQDLITGVANMLPDKLGGNALRDFADSLQSVKIGYADNAAAVDSATVAAQNFSAAVQTAAQQAMSAAAQVAQQRMAEQDKVVVDQAAIAYAQANGGSQATIDALTADMKAQQEKVHADNLRQAALDAKARGDDATYLADMAQAAYLDAAATASNTKATQDLTTSLGNMISGFRLGGYLPGTAGASASGGAGFGSSTGTGHPITPYGGPSGGGGGGVHFHGPVTIAANSPAELHRALLELSAKRRGTGGIFG